MLPKVAGLTKLHGGQPLRFLSTSPTLDDRFRAVRVCSRNPSRLRFALSLRSSHVSRRRTDNTLFRRLLELADDASQLHLASGDAGRHPLRRRRLSLALRSRRSELLRSGDSWQAPGGRSCACVRVGDLRRDGGPASAKARPTSTSSSRASRSALAPTSSSCPTASRKRSCQGTIVPCTRPRCQSARSGKPDGPWRRPSDWWPRACSPAFVRCSTAPTPPDPGRC